MGDGIGFRKGLALRLFSQLYKSKVKEHKLRTLFWECTLRCNLSCRHCGSDCRVDTQIDDMPIADFLYVLDNEITPNVNPADLFIILSGGEVLMRKDLEYAGSQITRRGYRWGMVSNGFALTRERLDSLLEAGLSSVSISLDGFEPRHNYIRGNRHSFERALAAIGMIVKVENLAFDVVTCVTKESISQLEEFKEFLISQGVKSWRIFTIFPVGRAKDDASLVLEVDDLKQVLDFIVRTRKEGRIKLDFACEGFLGGYEAEVRDLFYQCAAGISIASIRVDGAISGCTSIRSNFNQGDIYHDKFWEVWENKFDKYRNREWTRKNECANCKVFKYCLGGGMHLRDGNENLLQCHYCKLF